MRFQLRPGKGKHHMRDHTGAMVVLRPGDIIDCHALDLGGAIGKFEQLEPDPPPVTVSSTLTVVPAGDGTFNVVNPGSGLPLNDLPLSAQDASDLAGIPIAAFSEPVIAGSPPASETTAAEAGNTQTNARPDEDTHVPEA